MTDAFESKIREAAEGADASPPRPAALARGWSLPRPAGIRHYLVILWDAAPGVGLTLSAMISLVLLAAMAVLLTQELTRRTVTIAPVSIPKALASDGYLPGLAARCCETRRTHS